MHSRLWIAGFVFVMLLGGQIAFLPTQVLAGPNDWCGCGNCGMSITNPENCTCGPPFFWCLEDLMALQLQASVHNRPAETNSIPEALTSTIAKSDVTERVYLVSGGKCLHNKVTLHILGNAGQGLKFAPVTFD